MIVKLKTVRCELLLVIVIVIGLTLTFPTYAMAEAPLAGVSYRIGLLDANVRYQPYSPVYVKSGTRLQLTAGNGLSPVTWRKANTEVTMNERVHTVDGSLFIENFLPQDAGIYSADGYRQLHIIEGEAPQMKNASARGDVEGGKTVLIAGFCVSGVDRRAYLIRGVGPTLSKFGVAKPLSKPRVTIYDQNGEVYGARYAYSEYGDDITSEAHIAQVTQRVGAFPLVESGGDFVVVKPIVPGVYTVVLTAEPGDSGTALIEIYDGGAI